MTLDVDERQRFVVAKYFEGASGRSRATRQQVAAFALGAFRTAIRDHGDALRGRAASTAKRLAEGRPADNDGLIDPVEHQPSLFVL